MKNVITLNPIIYTPNSIVNPDKMRLYLLVLFLSIFCWHAAFAQTHQSVKQTSGVQNNSPKESPIMVIMKMMRSMPNPVWLRDGRLSYTKILNGHRERRIFNPVTREDTLFVDGRSQPSENSKWSKPRIVRPGLMGYSAPVREVPSPDDKWLAGIHDGNLWIRSSSKRDSVRLTTDGTSENTYDVLGAKWSPGSRRLALKKIDYHGVPTVPLVEWEKKGEPVRRHYYSRVGQPISQATLYIVDRKTGNRIRIPNDRSGNSYIHIWHWNSEGTELYFTHMSRFMKRLDLIKVDALTGKQHTLLTETSKTFIGGLAFIQGYNKRLESIHYVTFLKDGRFIWTSEREGWRRLYLYDKSGKLLHPLTPKHNVVTNLVDVDQSNGWVYYSARSDHGNPYNNAFYRVSLKGGQPQQLAEAPEMSTGVPEKNVKLSPDNQFFWVIHGRINEHPVMEIHASNGKLIDSIPIISNFLKEYKHSVPEPIQAKAADGKTDLYGVIFKPNNFNPAHKYPVIEEIYAGPGEINSIRSVLSPIYWLLQELANRGYIVVADDGRGTPGRSKAFKDAFYGEIGQHEIADHAAILQEISKSRTYMDMKRVGVFGHSWGGYFALRAMLLRPGLYKVGVVSSGDADLKDFRVPIEPFMGCTPSECPRAYERGSNTKIMGRLNGKLLIMHGTADEDVPFGESVKMIRALKKAGKAYNYAVFPGSNHNTYYDPYWFNRMAGFFRKNLNGSTIN